MKERTGEGKGGEGKDATQGVTSPGDTRHRDGPKGTFLLLADVQGLWVVARQPKRPSNCPGPAEE